MRNFEILLVNYVINHLLSKSWLIQIFFLGADVKDESVAQLTNQVKEILKSKEIDGVDIVVMPEAIFNRQNTAVDLPKSNVSFCDDKNVHFLLRDMSCAARNAKKYLVIDMYTKVDCARDDQKFCSNKTDKTNLYNMAMVFDRKGELVAK